MAKKQVTVNEEMIRGIMAGDIPNYGKDISVDDIITTDESDGNECEADNPGPVTVEKSTGKPKKRKDVTDSYRKEFLSGGNVLQRQQAYIGIDNYRLIQKFLSVVAPKISMSKFIDNVLTAHFEQYKEEIDGLYYNQINNEPLYKKIIMGDFFDTMTIVVVIIMVFLVLVIAIHASARLVQMTFGRKSGLKQKDTAKSNEAVKNAEPVNLPEQKKESPGIDERCAIYKEKYLTCKPLAKRAQVCIEQENACIIKYMLMVIDPKATMSGYINNIVDEHLKKYSPEIMKLYKDKES